MSAGPPGGKSTAADTISSIFGGLRWIAARCRSAWQGQVQHRFLSPMASAISVNLLDTACSVTVIGRNMLSDTTRYCNLPTPLRRGPNEAKP